MIKLLFCLILFVSYGKFCVASSGSCSSLGVSNTFNTTCSDTQYYCDVDSLCKPRDERCTSSRSCVNPFSGTEIGCDCDVSGRRCDIILNSYPLISGRKRQVRIEHDFITYKGFVWEYGCYGTRVLDINDPLFNSQRTRPTSTTNRGRSSCSYAEAFTFLDYTRNRYSRENYSLTSNNCQDFAAAFTRWLLDDCRVPRRKRATDTDDYFAQLIESCDSLIDNTDITFVVDTSGSIGSTNFEYVRNFIEDVIFEMNIGISNSRVAVILFESSATLYFNLNQITDKDSLIATIRNLPYSGGGTDIPEALDLLRTTAQDGSLGINNNNRQIAIFLTDGEGGDVVQSVAALEEANIFQVYTVGVGNARLDQLNLISSGNSDFVYYHSTFTETSLIVIADRIIERLREQFVVVQPQIGSMLGGTLIQLTGNNIDFDETAIYTCQFDDLEVEGIYLTQSATDQVLCVSPQFRGTGRMNFTISYSNSSTSTEKSILANDNFFSLPVEDSNVVETDDVLLLPDSQTIIRWSPDSIIPPYLHEAYGLTDNYTVDICLYQLDFESESYTFTMKLASDIPNNGTHEIKIPSIDQSENFTAGIIGVSLSEQFTSQSSSDVLSSVYSLLKKSPQFGLAYVATSLAARAICSAWCSSEPNDIGETLLNRLPPCPPVRDAALNDPDFSEENFLLSFYHPGASSCFRQAVFTSENDGSGQQCCYSEDGTLLVGPESGGTVDRYAPDEDFWKHQFHDVLPYIFCCKGLFSDCSAYYDKRPSDNGNRYDLNPPATIIGDPHIITLDGFKYTFNGKGEFLLIEHIDGRFTLQGRMISVADAISSSFFQQATVFSAVVGKQDDSDVVQFEINQQQNGIDVIVGGTRINLDGIAKEIFNNVVVFNLGDNGFAASFSSGCSIQVKEENGFISVFSVSVPLNFKNLTRGLMGNYNGDTEDDLMARNYTEPLLYNSTIEDIHNEFGITWFINSSESLFTYNQQIDQSWETFYDPFFRPIFEVTQNSQVLQSICGNNTFCYYDYTVTGNTDIALSTLNGSNLYDEIVQLSYPVTCEPPCVQGACVANDTCNCIAGYVGERCTEPVYSDCEVELCTNGGTCRKLGSSYICECVDGYTGLDCEIAPITGSDDDDEAVVIGIIIAIIVVVILLLLLSVTTYCCCRRSRKYV